MYSIDPSIYSLCVRVWTYYISWCTHTSASDAVTVGPIGAHTQVSAAFAIVTCRTGLVAVKSRPSCCTSALSRQRVTAENRHIEVSDQAAYRRWKYIISSQIVGSVFVQLEPTRLCSSTFESFQRLSLLCLAPWFISHLDSEIGPSHKLLPC